jgi:hypothetical protein
MQTNLTGPRSPRQNLNPQPIAAAQATNAHENMPLPVQLECLPTPARWRNHRVAPFWGHPGDDSQMPCLPRSLYRPRHWHWHLIFNRDLLAGALILDLLWRNGLFGSQTSQTPKFNHGCTRMNTDFDNKL